MKGQERCIWVSKTGLPCKHKDHDFDHQHSTQKVMPDNVCSSSARGGDPGAFLGLVCHLSSSSTCSEKSCLQKWMGEIETHQN